MSPFTTILGAGGPIADQLAATLAAHHQPFRLVSRNPKAIAGGLTHAADLTDLDQTIRAVAGSSIVYLLVGLQYDLAVWRSLWPRIMANTIEACKRAQAKLIFFDDVYMYGKVDGPMTEQTPYSPSSRKGEVRARIATSLMDEARAGNLTAIIARAADFHGPINRNGIANLLVLEPFSQQKTASWLVDADLPHSFTFTPDAAHGIYQLSQTDSAWNQIWHLPTAPDPPTGRQYVHLAATEFGVPAKFRVYSRPLLRIAGWFKRESAESVEMLYQYDSPYLFDSSKFARAFNFAGTPYPEAIHISAVSYLPAQSGS